jgi:hypothetical protein
LREKPLARDEWIGGEAVPKAEEWLAQSRRDAKEDEMELI